MCGVVIISIILQATQKTFKIFKQLTLCLNKSIKHKLLIFMNDSKNSGADYAGTPTSSVISADTLSKDDQFCALPDNEDSASSRGTV